MTTINLTPEELREWAEIGQAPCDYRTVGRYRELSAKLGSLASAPLALALADAIEERDRLATRVKRLEAENAKLRKCVEAADRYVDAVVTIESSPAMISVYNIAEAHHCPYSGANWSGELAAYRVARAEVKP